MLKIFSHYLPTHTLHQVLFDAALLFIVVLGAVAFQAAPGALDWAAWVLTAPDFRTNLASMFIRQARRCAVTC
jgi:hypothetical protein